MSYYIRKNGVTKKLVVIPEGYPAELIGYDNTGTNLQSDNAQDAITELDSGKVSKSGDSMSGELQMNVSAETQARFVRSHTDTAIKSSRIIIGNEIPDGTAGSSYGRILLYGDNAYYTYLSARNATANRQIALPNKSGTLALTDDIPTDFVSKASGGDFGGTVGVNRQDGTASSVGSSSITLGNNIAQGTAKNSRGYVNIYGTSAYYARLRAGALTANRNIDLPNKAGTLALLDDIVSLGSDTKSKIVNIYVGGSTSSVTGIVQEVLDAITTNNKVCLVNAVHQYSGIRSLKGYIYADKSYGSFIMQSFSSLYFCRINEGNITYSQII